MFFKLNGFSCHSQHDVCIAQPSRYPAAHGQWCRLQRREVCELSCRKPRGQITDFELHQARVHLVINRTSAPPTPPSLGDHRQGTPIRYLPCIIYSNIIASTFTSPNATGAILGSILFPLLGVLLLRLLLIYLRHRARNVKNTRTDDVENRASRQARHELGGDRFVSF